MTDRYVIKGGTLVDASGTRSGDVVVEGGAIVAVGPDLTAGRTVDATGCVVAPGLVDLGARTGEPGREQAETAETMSRAAALGGFTAVVVLPDTDPVVDNAAMVHEILALGRSAACEIIAAGALTRGLAGTSLAEMGAMASAGVTLFTDADHTVADARLMRRALEYASALHAVVAHHGQEPGLAAGGHMHEGEWSGWLGVPGMPAEAEEITVMRDIALARLTGCHLHFRKISTAGSLGMVRAARSGGLRVSADVTPHHLALTDADLAEYDPMRKVLPPLRPAADVEALRTAVVEGTIDAVASDHNPQPVEAKEAPFLDAEFGSIGLETALAVALTELAAPIEAVLAAFSWRPAAVAGVGDRHGHLLRDGAPANLCVVDPAATWTAGEAAGASRSTNSALSGRKLTGRVRHTILAGDPVVLDGEAQR